MLCLCLPCLVPPARGPTHLRVLAEVRQLELARRACAVHRGVAVGPAYQPAPGRHGGHQDAYLRHEEGEGVGAGAES
jgi:hypothetical protein